MSLDINSMMTKSEFMSEYYKRRPWYYVFLILTVACFLGAVVLLFLNGAVLINIKQNFASFNDAQMLRFYMCILAGSLIVLMVPGFFLTKKFNSQAVDAYSKYLSKLEMKPNHDEENLEAGDNEWKCKSCGRVNADYVGTCGCGERRA